MIDSPNVEEGTVDLSLLQRTAGLREQFERAWQTALRGGPEPSIENYLSAFTEPERTTLRSELQRITQDYRERLLRANEITHTEEPRGSGDTVEKAGDTAVPRNDATCALEPKPEPANGATCEFAPVAKVEDSQRTAEFVVNNSAAPALDGATMDFGPQTPDRNGATVDTANVNSAAFSLADASGVKAADDEHSVAGYEILEVLGRGAMGVVYKARQRGLKRIVALKMVLAGGHASELELSRFRTEAEAVAQLQHPNIVQVYEVGEQNGCPYLTLEYINGGSLQGKIASTPQPAQHAAQMVQVLAQAMDTAHKLGIIHRDLKPANVMLMLPKAPGTMESTQSQAPLVEQLYGMPKIADFGLAKRLEEDGGQTRSGTILGTPSYMAPEQAEGKSKSVGPLADQYALGAILYELLTGRPPFRGESVWDTLQQVRTREPLPPSQLQPKVPGDLETVCLKALQKEPSKRYQDCAALAEDLRRFVAGEPILARPIGNAERLWRWCQRNPKIAALTAAIFVMVLAFIGLLIGGNIRLTREKAETELERQRAVENENRAIANEAQARAAEKIAGATGALAQDLLREMLSKLQDLLADVPNAEELREEITRLAMNGSGKITESTDGQQDLMAHRDVARIRAKAFEQMGSLLFGKDLAKSAKQYEQAYAIAKDLAAAEPNNDKAQGNLAAMLLSLGELSLRKGDKTAARKYYTEALDIRKAIHDHPQSDHLTEIERKLGYANAYLFLRKMEANPHVARQLNLQALELRQQAVQLDPKNVTALHNLADSYGFLGQLSQDLHNLAEARGYFQQNVLTFSRLDPAYLRRRSVRRAQALAQRMLGETLLRLHQPKEARQPFEAALKIFKGLFEGDPKNAGLHFQLFIAYYGTGIAAKESADNKTATECFHQAIALIESQLRANPRDEGALIQTMLCRARLGEHVEAVKLAEQVRQMDPRGVLTDIAGCYALCIPAVTKGRPIADLSTAERQLAEQFAAKAMAALNQAKASADWLSLETEPDLAPLQGRPEFEKYLEDLRRAHPLPKPPTS